MKPVFILLLAACGLSSPAGAQTVFKWVDANGVTNYTTTAPPPTIIKVAELNASPVTNLVASSLPADELLYWRERRQRELANDISRERSRRDDDMLRQQLARQSLANDEQARKAEEARLQAAYDRCIAARRTDCVYGNESGGDGYGMPVVVVAANQNQNPGHHHPHPPGDHPPGSRPPPHAVPPVLVRPLPPR